MTCERCRDEALLSSFGGDEYYDIYKQVLKRNPNCTPREQAGQFWDEILEVDMRLAND